MKKETIGIWVAIITAVVAIIGVFVMWGQSRITAQGLQIVSVQLQREIARSEKIEQRNEEMQRIVLARKPKIEYLDSFIQPAAGSFWVVVPIINSSTSPSGVAHRVQVAIAFKKDNLIQKIDADPFRVIGGGEGDHSVTLELNVLYPGSIIYLSFLVPKGESPEEVSIGWAEQTGWQSIPLKG